MTLFMEEVQEVLAGGHSAAPSTVPSRLLPVASVTDRQVALRALAEQLVGEANAVIGHTSTPVQLADEATDGRLSFTLRCGSLAARVQATVAGHQALAELVAERNGTLVPEELASRRDLERLILKLVGSQRRQHGR